MPSPTPDPRLRRAERGLLALSGVLGIAASIWAFASRELTDFLGEGPVRVLSLSDAAQQTTIAVGLLLAALAWTALTLAPLPLWRYVLAGVAALIAVAFAPTLLLPMAALVALAALLAVLGSMSPDRRAALAPDRHPRAWAGSGAVALAGLVVASVVSVWLLRPLFDEGKQLDEALAFDPPRRRDARASPARWRRRHRDAGRLGPRRLDPGIEWRRRRPHYRPTPGRRRVPLRLRQGPARPRPRGPAPPPLRGLRGPQRPRPLHLPDPRPGR